MKRPGNKSSDRNGFAASVERIQQERKKGGIFVEAVSFTRMPMIVTDPSLAGNPIIFANEAFLDLFGYQMDELLGQTPSFLTGNGVEGEAIKQVNAALSGDRHPLVEIDCQRKDGSIFTSVLAASPSIDEKGRERHVYSFVDMSEHIALQQSRAASEQNFQLLVEGVIDYAIYMLDPEGHVVNWNAGAERIKGYTAEEVIGQHVSLFYTEEDKQAGRPQEALATARYEGRFEDESWRVRKDGSKFFAHVVIDAIRDKAGELVGFAKVTRDITQRQRMREAEHASEAKTQFLASMSHEIRTPLNSIIGYTERLMDERLTPDQRRYTERIQTAGSTLLVIINDILDWSQIEAGRIDLEERPFSLEKLVDNIVSIISVAAEAKGLSIQRFLDPELPRLVVADEGRLCQVLLNLLNNAVKFTHEGHVTLAIKNEGRTDEGQTLLFSVTDSGIGIPQDRRHRLFRRFSQVDSTIRREFGGTGLGLAISKRLIDLMGGEIGLESREGKGSTFWFRVILPSATPEAVTVSTEEHLTNHTIPGRILLAEDLEINQELARTILEAAGHQVDVVCNGAEAVDAVKTAEYDLVLMDIQMPIMDGIAATREIRSMGHDIPIIAMTANVLPQQVRVYKDGGFDDHVGKPMKRNDLLKKIAKWMPQMDTSAQTATLTTARRPAFDQHAFDALLDLMGQDQAAAWLKQLEQQLKALASTDSTAPDRHAMGRSAHAIVSQAGSLGFSDLSDTCMKLEEACVSEKDLEAPLEAARHAARKALATIPVVAERLTKP